MGCDDQADRCICGEIPEERWMRLCADCQMQELARLDKLCDDAEAINAASERLLVELKQIDEREIGRAFWR
jgi:hypothetical protein